MSFLRTLARSVPALVIAGLAAGRSTQGVDPAFMLKLRDGSIRWGSIESHAPEGLAFRRLDNGGLVQLAWRFLDPSQEDELRRRWGYVDESGEELMIEAQRLELIDGREVIGLVLSRGEDALLVKTAEATIPVPLDRIAAAASTVVVPALEIYTREELYQQELTNTSPDDASARLALARYCERILDYAHAVQHYQEAFQLDPGLATNDVRFAHERSKEKAARQAEIDWLAEVDLLRARDKFAAALERVEAFRESFPDSPLLPDAKKRLDRVLRDRDRALSEAIVRRWHSAATQLARRAVMKTFEEMQAWVAEAMGEELLALVVESAQNIDPEISPDRVRQIWMEREGGRWRVASYGYGTWLLGEDRALKGLEDEEEEEKAPAVTEKAKEREELDAKLKRYLENQRLQRRQSAAPDEAGDIEQTWREMSSASRSGWILAWYAENSGEMQVRERVRFRTCRECGGRGVRELLSTGDARTRPDGQSGNGSGITHIPCPTCHGLGVIRRIQYR